jgi:hypothetical protein
MIIWGSTGREKTISKGEFYCPACRGHAPYLHRKVSRYFTLYFIPLFPMEKLGEYVHCKQCNNQFGPQVLQLTEAQVEAMLQPWTCPACHNSNPPDHAECLGCGQPREAEAQEAEPAQPAGM